MKQRFRPGLVRSSPVSLGLPEKFPSFRAYPGYDQQETIRQIASAFLFRGKRWVIVNGPPGCGKSLIGAGVRNLLAMYDKPKPCRGLFLTISKPLQDQLANDFRALAIAKGRNNYRCVQWKSDCGMPQRLGDRCTLERPEKKGDGITAPISCPYRLAVNEAGDRDIACLNYSLWLAFGQHGDPNEIGEFGLMVGDEAHNILDSITDASAISLPRKDIIKLLGIEAGLSLPRPKEAGRKAGEVAAATDVSPWCSWAARHIEDAKDRLTKCRKSDVGRRAQLLTLINNMGRLACMADDSSEKQEGRVEAQAERKLWAPKVESNSTEAKSGEVKICRVFPSNEVCEQLLWRKIPRILLMSGSVSPQIIDELDISKDEAEYIEIQSAFAVKNRPIVYVSSTTDLKMRYDMDEGERRILVSRLDQIIRIWSQWHGGSNGLIHSNSYQWTDYILEKSKFAHLMISHGKGKAKEAVEKLRMEATFGNPDGPKVLISPALWEGYDFPGKVIEWVVVLKVPYLDGRNPLMAARKIVNPKYADGLIAKKFLQGSMRHIRTPEDRGPVFILDWNWTHFSWRATKDKLVPVYYSNAFRRSEKVPTPEQLFGKAA